MSRRGIGKVAVDYGLFPAIVTVFTMVLGLVFSEIQTKIGWWPLTAAAIVFLCMYACTLMIVNMQIRPVSTDLFERILDRLSHQMDRNLLQVVDNTELAKIESAEHYGEVWLVTADLAEEVPGKFFYGIVHKNLQKGAKYTYFAPRSFKTEGRLATIEEGHKNAGRIRFVFLPDDFFFLTPRLDFAIYDPLNVTGRRRGFMGLPFATKEHLHGPMDEELLDCLVGKLNAHVGGKDE